MGASLYGRRLFVFNQAVKRTIRPSSRQMCLQHETGPSGHEWTVDGPRACHAKPILQGTNEPLMQGGRPELSLVKKGYLGYNVFCGKKDSCGLPDPYPAAEHADPLSEDADHEKKPE